MMKIVEQLLAQNKLLNKHVKEKSFKIRAIAKDHVPAKRIVIFELNEGNEKINNSRLKIKLKNRKNG